jgi:hypothetical protein
MGISVKEIEVNPVEIGIVRDFHLIPRSLLLKEKGRYFTSFPPLLQERARG